MSTDDSGERLAPLTPSEMGSDVARDDARLKVTGTAPYAVEHPVEDPLYAVLVGAPFALGSVTVDASEALAAPGVHSVVDHTNAPRLEGVDDLEMDLLQSGRVDYHGQVVAIVLGESLAAARHGAHLVRVDGAQREAATRFEIGQARRKPDEVNAGFPTDSETGDVDAAVAQAATTVQQTYVTPLEHNNPMEPHAATATWREGGDGPVLEMTVSTQSAPGVVKTLAPLLGLEPEQVRVRAPHVGGGFGSKGLPHPPDLAAAMAARTVPGRPVRLAVTRQQMFALTGYRSITASQVRLAAQDDGTLTGIEHASFTPSSRVKEYAEQTSVSTRSLYAAPNRRTSHRLQDLDVAIPSWMRAPGVFPGVFAHEVAMDELAVDLGVDPVELRRRNDTDVDPDSGDPFSERRLLECFDRGAELFGWSGPQEPRSRVDGDWLLGSGVATATYPGESMPGNQACVTVLDDGRYEVSIAATDIGTGAWTVLRLVAADALGVPRDQVEMRIGDSSLPPASVAGGSAGTSSWGTAITGAARALHDKFGADPAPGSSMTTPAPDDPGEEGYVTQSYGAVFAEVGVHRWTGEVRARRLLGVYSAGRVLNPRGARSQLVGGMVMGLGAALHEESVRDPRFGHVVTQDLASYHVPAHADVLDVEAHWLQGRDDVMNPMGSRGIGEIGITGVAPAIVNAAYAATGVRVRELPLTPDHFL
ncbi:xanthine dehydrogenase family protein molybdopterin-binding subunit [Janibacter melonis]|uniref:xanthine dehydrogenase family protein molybdopterin-binding subunit n=1 Tax=Janibacter melonis TaxID=262209 RepID=UPI001CD9107D|nr:xanthine dehydrogenase family protein molybdopterin-binding subunit [Janibacter melonis]